jgi:F-type H+-transporting ATPase subunit b
MHFDFTTLALQGVNFLVLIWLLNRFVFKPLGNRLDERRAAANALAGELAQAQRRADEIDRERLAALAEITRLKAEALDQARSDIADERTLILKSAAEDALKLDQRAQAQRQEAERANALQRETEITESAIHLATALIEELDPDLMDQAYRKQAAFWLSQNPLEGDEIILRLAPQANRNLWQALVPDARCEIDESLIAGAVIDAQDRHIGFNMRDRLQALKTVLRHD